MPRAPPRSELGGHDDGCSARGGPHRRLQTRQVSATYFTVIGNVCKVITVLINVMIWDKHASPKGLACLFMCLAAAFLYQQAPLRPDAAAAAAATQPPEQVRNACEGCGMTAPTPTRCGMHARAVE